MKRLFLLPNNLILILASFMIGIYSSASGQWQKHDIDTDAPGAGIVEVADINNDNSLDVVAGIQSIDDVTWYENNHPNWTEYIIDPNLNGATGVSIADLDGDDTLDVVATGYYADDVVWYENGGGAPVTWTNWTIDPNLDDPLFVFAADIDGDSDNDVVATGRVADDVVWYENGGGTPVTWTKWTIDPNLDGANIIYVADIDDDYDNDIIVTGYWADDVIWYENGGGTPVTWTKWTIDPNLDGAYDVFVADIDGDDTLDVAVTGYFAGEVVWYENGGGTPVTWTKHNIDNNSYGPSGIHCADIDDDNDIDVVVTEYDGANVVLYINDNLSWTRYIIDPNLVGANDIHVADIDGDDTLDVLATGYDGNGWVGWYENPGPPIGIEHNPEVISTEYFLYQNYPNPFNPITNIEFSIPKSEFVTLRVYNILGEEVAILVSEKLPAGSYKYDWDASSLASGIYLYRIQAGDYMEAKKTVLMR